MLKTKGSIMEKNSTTLTNDPYLHTARLTIKDKYYKRLYNKKKKREQKEFFKSKS